MRCRPELEHRLPPSVLSPQLSGETPMTKLKLLGAAALLSMAVATPVSAQTAIQEPGAYAQDHPWATDYNYNYRYRSGFWPGDVAGGVVVGSADTIVAPPFRGSAYDANAYYAGPDEVYDYRSTCGPQAGATYLGPDGRWYPCN
jgi:hypothetical protein